MDDINEFIIWHTGNIDGAPLCAVLLEPVRRAVRRVKTCTEVMRDE